MIKKKQTTWFDKDAFIAKILEDSTFSHNHGNLGRIYGYQWRKWSDYYGGSVEYIDQITNLINELKTNPDSRRLMVTAWNPSELDEMILPPCHYGFQLYTKKMSDSERFSWYKSNSKNGFVTLHDRIEQEMDAMKAPTRKISLMWNQRSVDTALGLPYNIASYGLLLHILGKMVNMVPYELVGNLGDTHLYSNHMDYAHEVIDRWKTTYIPLLPELEFVGFDKVFSVDDLKVDNFKLNSYVPLSEIKAPLSN